MQLLTAAVATNNSEALMMVDAMVAACQPKLRVTPTARPAREARRRAAFA